MRFLLCFALVLWLVATSHAQKTPIVRVYQAPPPGSSYGSLGSGVHIATDNAPTKAGLILTAAHVVDGPSRITVAWFDQGKLNGKPTAKTTARLIGRINSTDIAALEVDPPDDAIPAYLAESNPVQGTKTYTAGFAQGEHYRDYAGTWGVGGVGVELHNTYAISGQSGGPVYRADTKEVVAIISASDEPSGAARRSSYAVPVSRFRAWLYDAGWRFRSVRNYYNYYDANGTYCPNGRCYPQQRSGGGGGYGPPQSDPGGGLLNPAPSVPPNSNPPQQAPTPAPTPEPDAGDLADVLKVYRGKDGKDGRDGKDAVVDYDKVVAAVVSKLPAGNGLTEQDVIALIQREIGRYEPEVVPSDLARAIQPHLDPITIQIQDPDGGVLDQHTQPLGGIFRFRLMLKDAGP